MNSSDRFYQISARAQGAVFSLWFVLFFFSRLKQLCIVMFIMFK